MYCTVVYCTGMFCPVLSCPVLSCPILFYPILSCPVLSCPVLSCPVLSYPILSCPVLSCTVLYCTYCIVCTFIIDRLCPGVFWSVWHKEARVSVSWWFGRDYACHGFPSKQGGASGTPGGDRWGRFRRNRVRRVLPGELSCIHIDNQYKQNNCRLLHSGISVSKK